MNKKIIFVTIATVSIALTGYLIFNSSKNIRTKVTDFNDKHDYYTQQIQPIFDNKCVACHSCFNSPCQLNLTSYEGIQRGAHKENIFDFNTLKAKKPTRLFQDAHNEKQWRDLGFFSVTNNESKNLLIELISNLEGVESGKQKHYDSEYSRVCVEDASKESLEIFKKHIPAGRMPYGLPALSQDEVKKIQTWIDTGATGPNYQSIETAISNDKRFSKKIKRWEDFFNRKSMKAQISSRYLYEHLFLASIYFEDSPDIFFRLVRSKSKTGTINELATDYPFDKPEDNFYYRLRSMTQTIVHKRHIPFPFSEKRMKKWNKGFYHSKWKKVPNKMPPYGRQASNPFKTFESIPSKARYDFFLKNSAYHVMTFIKGPVCRGQTAVNVINDHFWVLFLDPSKDVLVNNEKAYKEVTENIKFPSSIKDDFSPLIDFRKNYWKTVQKKFEHIKELDPSWLWSSDKTNTNTTLTIYRHFDSAQVIRGLRGRRPKTVWVLDYHVFESIYYNLSAGYNVFGPLLHQVNSRLFMEISRVASEDLFLSFLDKNTRHQLRKKWNMPVAEEKESITKELVDLLSANAKDKLTKKYIYSGTHIKSTTEKNKDEFLDELITKVYNQDQMLSNFEDQSREIYQLAKMNHRAVSHLPDATILKIGNEIYTLINNKDHYNVSMLFFEDDRRNRENDTVDIIKGVATSYINLILDVTPTKKTQFIQEMSQASSKKDLSEIYKNYALKRDSSKFWDVFIEVSKKSKDELTHERGILDLNRYINI